MSRRAGKYQVRRQVRRGGRPAVWLPFLTPRDVVRSTENKGQQTENIFP